MEISQSKLQLMSQLTLVLIGKLRRVACSNVIADEIAEASAGGVGVDAALADFLNLNADDMKAGFVGHWLLAMV